MFVCLARFFSSNVTAVFLYVYKVNDEISNYDNTPVSPGSQARVHLTQTQEREGQVQCFGSDIAAGVGQV